VVSVGPSQGFVVADIPGLIEGAAEGAGLGIQFLKHVSRTRLLLHLVDVAPLDGADPVEQVRIIERELQRHDPALLERPRWLLLNKIDLWAPEERDANARAIVERLDWQAPWFAISAAERLGTREVCLAAQRFFDERKADAGEDPDAG
jgi:GTP-binding protein